MALELKKINPLDRQPRKAVGVDLPFSGNAVFNSTFQTKDALKVNLINYLLTNKGERPLNPSFGAGIRELLFENINQEELEDIKENISTNITRFFPTIKPTRIEVTSNPDTNIINFFLRYAIADQNIEDEFLINIE
jgi:phage baseplate assembly protein W|tara:strand:+ start:54 stop:461 length:408 start_codon:yes stop_codon:yes gene_type:complete